MTAIVYHVILVWAENYDTHFVKKLLKKSLFVKSKHPPLQIQILEELNNLYQSNLTHLDCIYLAPEWWNTLLTEFSWGTIWNFKKGHL